MRLTRSQLGRIIKEEVRKISRLKEAAGGPEDDAAMLSFFSSVKHLVGFYGAAEMHRLLDSALAGDRPWVSSDDDDEESDYWSPEEKAAGREREEALRNRR